MAYFKQESQPTPPLGCKLVPGSDSIQRASSGAELAGRSRAIPPGLGIGRQLDALLTRVKSLVANGAFSERSLANSIGMSQPHVHHLLSGGRALTVPVADHLLARLQISVAELLDESEVRGEFDAIRRERAPKVAIPILTGRLGPGGPFPRMTADIGLMECGLIAHLVQPALVALGEDRTMDSLLQGATHALLHNALLDDWDASGLYAIEQEGVLLARGIRPGLRCAYLLTAETWNRPSAWQRVAPIESLRRMIPIRIDRKGLHSIAMPAAAAAS